MCWSWNTCFIGHEKQFEIPVESAFYYVASDTLFIKLVHDGIKCKKVFRRDLYFMQLGLTYETVCETIMNFSIVSSIFKITGETPAAMQHSRARNKSNGVTTYHIIIGFLLIIL
jgi:hypothetical protein